MDLNNKLEISKEVSQVTPDATQDNQVINLGQLKGIKVSESSGGKAWVNIDSGVYHNTSSPATGFLNIKLPTGYGNNRLSFTVNVYESSIGRKANYKISGDNFIATSNWISTAVISEMSDVTRDLPVSFGDDGTDVIIQIGSVDTQWYRPVISITDIYSRDTLDIDSLEISINTTVLVNTSATKTNNLGIGDANKLKNLTDTPRLYTAQQGTSLTPTEPTDYVNKEYVDGSVGITNITEIPNRSYNDLQDLPTKPFKEVDTQQYTLVEEDKNKFLVFTYAGTVDLDVPQSVFVDTDTIVGFRDVLNESYRININGFEQDPSLSFVQSARGKTNIVNNLGSFDIRFYANNASVLNGDLVEEYTTRQSPDGTLWKIAVDNTGTEVITAL